MQAMIYPDTRLQAGLGHVVRCLALAQALESDGVEVVLVSRRENQKACDYLSGLWQKTLIIDSRGPLNEDIKAIELSLEVVPDWLVVDNYAVDEPWLNASRPLASRIAVIDDLADRKLDCDLVVNQNLGYEESYGGIVPPQTRLLIGTKYSLLRPEFAQARERLLRIRTRIHRLLVFFGGADSSDYTGRTIRALDRPEFGDMVVDVVVGAGYQHVDRLARLLGAVQLKTEIHHDIVAASMATLTAEADLCVGAPGSASWERCCLGLPAIVFVLADNQRRVGAELGRRGLAIVAGADGQMQEDELASTILTLKGRPELVARMSSQAAKLVDGFGAGRVSHALLSMVGAHQTN